MSGLGEFASAGDRGLINVSIYYRVGKTKSGSKKILVLSDEEAEKLLEKSKPTKEGQEPSQKIETFNTKWRPAVWQDQNKFIESAQRINPQTMQPEINWNRYRDIRIKELLVDWDLEHQGQKIPVSPDMIDKLPTEIVLGIYDKYESEISYSPDEEEK